MRVISLINDAVQITEQRALFADSSDVDLSLKRRITRRENNKQLVVIKRKRWLDSSEILTRKNKVVDLLFFLFNLWKF
jgi:hypothetical protein